MNTVKSNRFRSSLPLVQHRVLSFALFHALSRGLVSPDLLVKFFGGVLKFMRYMEMSSIDIIQNLGPMDEAARFELGPNITRWFVAKLLERDALRANDLFVNLRNDRLIEKLSDKRVYAFLFDNPDVPEAAQTIILLYTIQGLLDEEALNDGEKRTPQQILEWIGYEEFKRMPSKYDRMRLVVDQVFQRPSRVVIGDHGAFSPAADFFVKYPPILQKEADGMTGEFGDAVSFRALRRVVEHWALRQHWISEMLTIMPEKPEKTDEPSPIPQSSLRAPRTPTIIARVPTIAKPPGTVATHNAPALPIPSEPERSPEPPAPRQDPDPLQELSFSVQTMPVPPNNRPDAPPLPPDPPKAGPSNRAVAPKPVTKTSVPPYLPEDD